MFKSENGTIQNKEIDKTELVRFLDGFFGWLIIRIQRMDKAGLVLLLGGFTSLV